MQSPWSVVFEDTDQCDSMYSIYICLNTVEWNLKTPSYTTFLSGFKLEAHGVKMTPPAVSEVKAMVRFRNVYNLVVISPINS